jgi:hypothetical protein
MIIKNNYLRFLYNLAKWGTYPTCIGMMAAEIFSNQPVKMIAFCFFLCFLWAWNDSRDALSE